MTRQRVPTPGGALLFDDSLAAGIDESWFTPGFWEREDAVIGAAGGRGTVLFVRRGEAQWVLRHYPRGGFVGRWLYDHFLDLGEANTRSFREWAFLRSLDALGLPVPRPVGARCVRHALVYTADLLTVRIPGAEPLSGRITDGALPGEAWSAVGAGIRRFHDADVYHPDLTANNILLDPAQRMHLLDFDRGRFRAGRGWRRANLDRLARSLHKIGTERTIAFTDADWQSLLQGYRSS